MYCTADDVIAADSTSPGDSVLGEMMGVEANALLTHPDIAKAVLSASRRIDSYLSVRYPVPLPVPAPHYVQPLRIWRCTFYCGCKIVYGAICSISKSDLMSRLLG